MTFLGSSDHFSLGSKWFWYLQNDKMYTLGPTESPSGVGNGLRRAKKWPPKPYLAHFGLFSFSFWAQARNFSKSFWAKIGQFFPKNFSLHCFDSQRVWDPQKPKIDPVDPPVDPILAQFVGKKADFGVKKRVFLKIIFYRFPDGVGPSKTQNWPFKPPKGPHLVPFCGHFGPIWGQKTRFSQNFFLLQMIFYRFPDGRGPSKTQNWPFIPPNGPQMTYIGFPHGLGPSKHPKLVFYTPPPYGHLLSPRIPLGLAKSSALFKP